MLNIPLTVNLESFTNTLSTTVDSEGYINSVSILEDNKIINFLYIINERALLSRKPWFKFYSNTKFYSLQDSNSYILVISKIDDLTLKKMRFGLGGILI